jgi:replicative DNA helicase
LRKPILVRLTGDAETIAVNFDPMIEAVIREVTYMRRLGVIELPEAVMQFYSKASHLLKDKAQLQLTVELYESTQAQLLDVERSLLETRLAAISNELDRGMDAITWRSSSIASFISLVSTQVSDLSTAVHSLHRITQMIQALIPTWSKRMIYKDEMMRCLPSHQYLELQASHTAARYYEVQDDVSAIDKQIVACRMLLGVNNKSLAWQRRVCPRLALSSLLRSE